MAIDSKRKDHTQLPAVKELELILDKEAKRPIADGKESKHFASFDLPTQWLEMLGISGSLFTTNRSWQELVLLGDDVQAEVVAKTMQAMKEEKPEFLELMKEVTAYLGQQDAPEPSDAIFVFGSKSLARIEIAVDLFTKKLAPRIFISGGAPVYKQREQSEAQVFKAYAVEHGVSASAVALHDGAITVADNVRGGLNSMDEQGLPHNSLILVTAWFAMRRSWAHMMKYVSEDTHLYRVNAPVTANGNFTEESWFRNETGIKTIFNEFGKLRISEMLNTS